MNSLHPSVAFLYSRQNMGIKLGLGRTVELMEAVGSPHLRLPCIQIVGTNGKGSTAAFAARIFQTAGIKTGLSTSPHLVNVNERIRINGTVIPNQAIIEFVDSFRQDIERIGSSFFECITAMAFWYFDIEQVDIAVLETGLGGRLDSVSVCQPKLVLVSSIALDHTEILGSSLAEIAAEKAGAFKAHVPCISVPQQAEAAEILKQMAQKAGTNIRFINPEKTTGIDLGLHGSHQCQNAALAMTAALELSELEISQKDIRKGLAATRWPGRFQILDKSPLVVFDVGHNEAGITSFLDEFEKVSKYRPSVLILALQHRKRIVNIIPRIEQIFHRVVCTETDAQNTMNADLLCSQFSNSIQREIEPDCEIAIRNTLTQLHSSDALAIVGSHYLGQAVCRNFKFSFSKL